MAWRIPRGPMPENDPGMYHGIKGLSREGSFPRPVRGACAGCPSSGDWAKTPPTAPTTSIPLAVPGQRISEGRPLRTKLECALESTRKCLRVLSQGSLETYTAVAGAGQSPCSGAGLPKRTSDAELAATLPRTRRPRGTLGRWGRLEKQVAGADNEIRKCLT